MFHLCKINRFFSLNNLSHIIFLKFLQETVHILRLSIMNTIILLFLATSMSCSQNYVFPYAMQQPAQTFTLPASLHEISGLTISADGKHLIAVQDEAAKLLVINKADGELLSEVPFGEDGDFEGVEVAGDDIYAIKSSGTIYRICHFGKKNQRADKIKTSLDKTNNVEGVAFDAANNRLLLACKGNAGAGEAFLFKRAIYGFDLSTQSLNPNPVYLISIEDIRSFLEQHPGLQSHKKLSDTFAPGITDFGFCPSGIAIHPGTGDLYILSSVGKMLLVLSPAGQIRHIEKLDKDIHAQPEGICFDKDGALYVANEGRVKGPVIYRFYPKS